MPLCVVKAAWIDAMYPEMIGGVPGTGTCLESRPRRCAGRQEESRMIASNDDERDLARRPARSQLVTGAIGWLAAFAASAQMLAVDLVDSPAHGVALNARGDVVGSFSSWPCGDPHACVPETRTVVWRAEGRLALPGLGSLKPDPAAIAEDGTVVGSVTDFATTSRAVVWRLVSGAYEITDLGLLPGATSAAAVGVDSTGRVIGYASSPSAVRPFYWTASTGLVDLASQGFPAEPVLGVSDGGVVATAAHTYQIDNVASVRAIAPPPAGYRGPGGYAMRVNNLGDVATFLATTTSEPIFYLQRYRAADARWQLLPGSPNGNLSRWYTGSIDDGGTVTATVTSTGVVADGPAGVAVDLSTRLSPGYGGAAVSEAGPHVGAAGTLATVMIGRSPRLARLVAVQPCTGYCLRVASLEMKGVFVEDPRAPGSCTPAAANKVTATLSITDADGNPANGAKVSARFLDDYALNAPVSAKTNRRGKAVLRFRGPACVGAVALLVESVSRSGADFDRSVGRLTNYVIPLP